MKYYVRFLGHNNEPVLPAQELVQASDNSLFQVQCTSTVTTTVHKVEVYNSNGEFMMDKYFLPPMYATPDCVLHLTANWLHWL